MLSVPSLVALKEFYEKQNIMDSKESVISEVAIEPTLESKICEQDESIKSAKQLLSLLGD